MSYLAIAQEIGKVLADVTGSGKVHLYHRHVTELAQLKEYFFDEDQGRLCGWTISRESFKDDQQTNIENERLSTYVMRGYYSHNDKEASELGFQDLCDNIAEAFRPQGNLNETCEKIYPVQARLIGYVEIGGVLNHYCELTLDVQEFLSA